MFFFSGGGGKQAEIDIGYFVLEGVGGDFRYCVLFWGKSLLSFDSLGRYLFGFLVRFSAEISKIRWD